MFTFSNLFLKQDNELNFSKRLDNYSGLLKTNYQWQSEIIKLDLAIERSSKKIGP